MKLTNRTILIIGNEATLSLSIIRHYTYLNNKIILMSTNSELQLQIQEQFPTTIVLSLNFYEECDRIKLVEELNSRYLSPSCVVYNEFSYANILSPTAKTNNFQSKIEAFYTSLTHLDECLMSFLETEADATVAYLFPKLPWSPFYRRKMLYILKKTMLSYINFLNRAHPYIRFLFITYPIKNKSPFSITQPSSKSVKQNHKFIVQFKRLLENYHFPQD